MAVHLALVALLRYSRRFLRLTALAQTALPTIQVGAHRAAPAARSHVFRAWDDPSMRRRKRRAFRRLSPQSASPDPAAATHSLKREVLHGQGGQRASFARPGDALEIVPGLVVTQHSGEGKANQ